MKWMIRRLWKIYCLLSLSLKNVSVKSGNAGEMQSLFCIYLDVQQIFASCQSQLPDIYLGKIY